MNDTNSEDKVLVQVVPLDEDRQQIGWGESTAELLQSRLDDIRSAISEGAKAVADSLEGLPGAKGWQLGEVSAKFGVTLTAEAGVLLSRASAGATFEVTVLFKRDQNQSASN
jgi:Trypsin-co-occurring domain 1